MPLLFQWNNHVLQPYFSSCCLSLSFTLLIISARKLSHLPKYLISLVQSTKGCKKVCLKHVSLLLSKLAFSHWILWSARTVPTAWTQGYFSALGLRSTTDPRQGEIQPCTWSSVLLISVQGAWAGPLSWTTRREKPVLRDRGSQRHWKFFAHDGKYDKFKIFTHGSQRHCKAGRETSQEDTTMLEWNKDKSQQLEGKRTAKNETRFCWLCISILPTKQTTGKGKHCCHVPTTAAWKQIVRSLVKAMSSL